MTSNTMPLLETTDLGKTYSTGAGDVVALAGVDVAVSPGTLTVVRGRSGSGKTTLLNLLGGLDEPTTGTVCLDGADMADMDERTRSSMRRSRIGFVFQAFGLLPILTAAENVEVPMRMMKLDPIERAARSASLLAQVGLSERAGHRPDELSGGEQQRVSIARALANRPGLLLADEPTGQLDSRTGAEIIDLIVGLVHSEGIGAVLVTHDPAPVAHADRVIELSDGRVVAAPAP